MREERGPITVNPILPNTSSDGTKAKRATYCHESVVFRLPLNTELAAAAPPHKNGKQRSICCCNKLKTRRSTDLRWPLLCLQLAPAGSTLGSTCYHGTVRAIGAKLRYVQ